MLRRWGMRRPLKRALHQLFKERARRRFRPFFLCHRSRGEAGQGLFAYKVRCHRGRALAAPAGRSGGVANRSPVAVLMPDASRAFAGFCGGAARRGTKQGVACRRQAEAGNQTGRGVPQAGRGRIAGLSTGKGGRLVTVAWGCPPSGREAGRLEGPVQGILTCRSRHRLWRMASMYKHLFRQRHCLASPRKSACVTTANHINISLCVDGDRYGSAERTGSGCVGRRAEGGG
ncbi:hypothetical protein OKW20_003685 [Ensifer sp. LBL]